MMNLKRDVNKLLTEIPKKKVGQAFLASLSTRRLDWRSAIGSYANAQLNLTGKRPFRRPGKTQFEEEDLNVLNFERIKWAGVRHGDLLYNFLDLTLLQKEEIPQPTEEDISIFKNILDCINLAPPGEYPSKLRDRLKLVMKGSKDERHTIMEILACCEILQPQDYDRPIKGRHDWTFVEFWRGEDKFQQKMVDFYFGSFL